MQQTYGWGFKPLLTLFLFCLPLHAANEQYAVVRIPSHGASATVIATQPGRTWLLGCGHAYQGQDRYKPMVFDIAQVTKREPRKITSRLLHVDYQADLSLVLLDDGPMDFVAHVAPSGHSIVGHTILSCGFDEMTFPMHQPRATILRDDGTTWWTQEMPWHGRSGGGLIDSTSGYLIGVVQGYSTPGPSYRSHPDDPRCKGMYVNLRTVQAFIANYNGSSPSTPQPKQFSPQFRPSQPRPTQPCPPSG